MEFTIGTLLLGAIVIPILYLIHCYTFWKRQGIPCATGLIPLVGNIFRVILFKSSFSCFCLKVYKENKNCSMVGFYKLTKPVLLIRDPELVKMVLLNHFASFHDNSASVDPHLDPLMAKSPFFTYGDVWMTGRRRLMYALSGKNLKVLFEGVSSVCGKFDNFLERKLQANANEFELKNLFSKFTAEVVANAALGIEGFCFEDESRASSFDSIGRSFLQPSFKNGIIQAFIFFMPQLKGILKIKFIPTDVDAFFRVLVKELLKNRRNGTASRNDFFQLMMEMEKTSEAENLDEELLTSYCLSFFVEGFETSSITLSFVSYQLAIHKEIQEKVREEIMSVMSKYNGAITYEGLKEMTYMEQVINESQRCYPALGVMAKNCTAEFELKGPDGLHCKVKPGMEIVISVCGLHTDSKYWPDPETFDPERFNDERKKDIQKLTFIPFGDGPRICVGMRLAMLQMKACLAALLSKYAIELSPKTQLPIRLSPRHFLLTPVGGFWVYIKKI